ncbi:MAG: hypothetical protein M5U14_02105 [Acidimicrobiia bacterium]|nr:hypothetical protein [Acidimicrobiia bacterium]
MSAPVDPARVLERLRRREPEMAELLGRLAALESPSTEPPAQRPLFDELAARLEELEFAVRPIRGREVGDHLFARPRHRPRGRPRQLLLGHLDTVWPRGRSPTCRSGRRTARSPGPGPTT